MQRTIFPALLIFLLAIVQAAAQLPQSHQILGDPNKFADAHIKGLDAQVHLSDEQKKTLRPLFYAEGQTLIAIMTDASLSQEQRGQMIQKIHEQTAAKVASILTPEQRKSQEPPSRPQPSSQQVPNRI